MSVSNIDYIDINQYNLRNKHIICQSPDIKFVLSNTLEKYDVIEKNIILATEDFKRPHHNIKYIYIYNGIKQL